MILIDAVYVNNGGGKVLLDYIVKRFNSENYDVFYLFDERCKDDYLDIKDSKKKYIKSSLRERYSFYKEQKDNYNKVLCFGNIPPLCSLSSTVYTYFHQPMYLNIPKEFNWKSSIKFRLKQIFLDLFKVNSDYWLVQNSFIKKGLIEKYKLKDEKVLLVPFYPNEDLKSNQFLQEKNTFIYVSNGTPHKNHDRLLDAFCRFYDEYKIGKLIVTINSTYNNLNKVIINLQNNGYPIVNIGFVGREELIKNYYRSEYLIFPSLEESFGLGIVEAIECGCKVIGADLPYMYQVCDPSITFNPLDIEDIKLAFVKAINKEEEDTMQKIFNEVDQLISLLKE